MLAAEVTDRTASGPSIALLDECVVVVPLSMQVVGHVNIIVLNGASESACLHSRPCTFRPVAVTHHAALELLDGMKALKIPVGRRKGHGDRLAARQGIPDQPEESSVVLARVEAIGDDAGNVLGLDETRIISSCILVEWGALSSGSD